MCRSRGWSYRPADRSPRWPGSAVAPPPGGAAIRAGRLRRLVSREFTPRRVETLRPFTRAVADELIDGVLEHGRADLIGDFSVPLTSRVIMKLVGVPSTDIKAFQDYSTIFLSTDPAD